MKTSSTCYWEELLIADKLPHVNGSAAITEPPHQ
jgi:hypothetical protein